MPDYIRFLRGNLQIYLSKLELCLILSNYFVLQYIYNHKYTKLNYQLRYLAPENPYLIPFLIIVSQSIMQHEIMIYILDYLHIQHDKNIVHQPQNQAIMPMPITLTQLNKVKRLKPTTTNPNNGTYQCNTQLNYFLYKLPSLLRLSPSLMNLSSLALYSLHYYDVQHSMHLQLFAFICIYAAYKMRENKQISMEKMYI